MTNQANPFDPKRGGGGDDATRVAGERVAAGDGATNLVLPRPGGGPMAAPAPAAPVPSDAGQSLLQPGTVLNNTQRIEALIGRGGMGEVYRAINIHTGDQDAIKMIRPDLASDPQVRELFRREAAALRKVRHPSVVSYEGVFGDDSGRLFLVMEFVDGPSLASVIAQAPLPPADVRRVGVQIAEGLAAAHACGVVHRDLSPDNVVLRNGRLDHAVLIDFGVAKRLDATSTVVGSGFAGKLDYCSPEQCGLFDGVDHRTDIYSLGLVLAAAAVGKHLPMGSSLAHAVRARETQPDLSAVPEELRADLARLLEPDPARRPQSMREVAALLAYDPAATPALPPSAMLTARRTVWIAGGVAAMLALFAGGVFLGPRLMSTSTGGGTVTAGGKPPGGSPAAGTTVPAAPSAEPQRREADAARQKAEDDRRAAEAQRAAEEARRQEAERAAAERRRQDEEATRRAETERRAQEQQAAEAARRKAEEDAQRQATERAAAERRRAEEEAQRRAEDARRQADEQRRAEDARRQADDQRRAEDARRQAEEQRHAEEARRQADEQRRAEEARRKAEQDRRSRETATTPPSPPAPTAPPPQQQATRTPPSAPPATLDGAWRGQICFRRLALTPGNETCGPLSMTVSAGGAVSGTWVINSVTYGVAGNLAGGGGQVTLDMPPTGRGSSLGGRFTLPVRLNAASLQGQGYTQNDVLVMFSAGR